MSRVGFLGAPLGRAAVLLTVEALALTVIGVGYAASGVLGRPEDRTATVLAGVIVLAAGLLLLRVARALARERGWAWSPTVVTQLFLVVVGVGLVQGRVWWAAVPMLALAAGVLSQLASPQARDSYRGRE